MLPLQGYNSRRRTPQETRGWGCPPPGWGGDFVAQEQEKLPLVRLVPRPDLVLPELGGVVGGCPPDRPPRRREVRPHRFVDELEQSHPPLGDEVGAAGGVAFRIALLAKGVTVGIRNLNFCECILGRSPLPLPTSPKLFGRS